MNTEKELLQQSLIRISAGLSALSGALRGPDRKTCGDMVSLLDRSIIPQLAADCPLLVAVTGGGSTGKSTIFNLLAGEKASAADPKAGFTRRMVAAIHPNVASDTRKMELLFERFRANAHPRRLENPDEALSPGDPVYVECPDIPEHLVYVDTPDFDTGTREGFTNRAAAKEILDVADVILYIATNATYNNKSSTDFVRSVLSEVGLRKVALLYRFSPVYPDEMVREHMDVLLANLYPDEPTARGACIGIWRIDESNEVAAGIRDPQIRPLTGGIPLANVLADIDPTKTRMKVLQSAIIDTSRHTHKWIEDIETMVQRYEVYGDALRFLTSDTCLKCTRLAPQKDILKLFDDEWKRAQPRFVRCGRWLTQSSAKFATQVKGIFTKKTKTDTSPSFEETFRKSFLENTRNLQKDLTLPKVCFDFPKTGRDLQKLAKLLHSLADNNPGDYSIKDMNPNKKVGNYTATVSRPEMPTHDGPGTVSAGDALSRMAVQAAAVMGDTESIRPEIRKFVSKIRGEMTFWQSAKEGFSASLESLAVVGAVLYVVGTGDLVSGGTVLSLFGWNDLIAVPALGAFIATKTGIDKKVLETQMSKLFTEWATEKVPKILSILEKGITGEDIAFCDESSKRLSSGLENLKTALAEAREHASAIFPSIG
jgi:hypothetical protein